MGSKKVPAGLRALGVRVVTLSERYGVHEGQFVEDVRWMPEAAAAGEAALMADDAIRRRNPEERRVLRACGLRAFVVNASIRAEDTVGRFEVSQPAIVRAPSSTGCIRPGSRSCGYRPDPDSVQRTRDASAASGPPVSR